MKTLARLIERELQAGKWKHYAVYEHELTRVWPLEQPERDGNKEALEQVEKATDIEPGSDRS